MMFSWRWLVSSESGRYQQLATDQETGTLNGDDDQGSKAGPTTAIHKRLLITVVAVCAVSLTLLNTYAGNEESDFVAQHRASHTKMSPSAGQRVAFCSGSLHDTRGSWQTISTAQATRQPHAYYDQVPWNVCGRPSMFASSEERYVRETGCLTLDLLDGMDALGGRALHLVGDSLTRYTYISLRAARRRALLEFLLCGNRAAGSQPALPNMSQSEGLASQIWTTLQGSQGMEGDFRIHVNWINSMRRWLGWESDRDKLAVSNGLSYTPLAHAWCSEHWPVVGAEEVDFASLFKLFFRPNATEPSDDVLLLNMGAWYNLERRSNASEIGTDAKHVLDALTKVHAGSPEERLSAFAGPDPCLMLSVDPPATKVPKNRPQRYARDVIRLARWLAANRQGLPRHIFWVDARTQHFPPWGPYIGFAPGMGSDCVPVDESLPSYVHTWRNDVAAAVLAEMAPFITRIHLDPIMMPRYMDSMGLFNSAGKKPDCTHYCLGSASWSESMESTITAVVHTLDEVEPASERHTRSNDAHNGVCVASVVALDRFVSTGIFVVVAATSPVLFPALLLLCYVGSHVRRRYYNNDLLSRSSGKARRPKR
jgi:hypothetical protein